MTFIFAVALMHMLLGTSTTRVRAMLPARVSTIVSGVIATSGLRSLPDANSVENDPV
jgi:hypothetical protein